MSTDTQNPSCYVCDQPVLVDDLKAWKTLDDADTASVRHFWHMVPNDWFVRPMIRYAMSLEDAKKWAEEKLQDGYKAPEQREEFKVMLEEVERLLAKR